ncbi:MULTISPECIES: HAMP domain-containing protein [unclassified Lentimicrobium]|uniref:HAMP domain-containing sensor histidine kinase n=1 Tax=unclassified Lentimicrobium TaxID=2677434 RepID=UPI0015568B30|nr:MULTISPECIES: HAMP domain-containing protein [unclassified Lentimicrobium]NPD45396.1 HAMP domain-containing protein [Lentimicrobium sp. S6]NPD86868.1 HAMP domain-containing protein [Lentimicrobium sp. L6]
MRRFSITDKLIIASLALSIITILIVASYSFTNAKEAILNRTFSQLTSVRVIKSNLLDQFFSNCIKEIQIAKSSSDIIEITKQLNQLKTDPSKNSDLIQEHELFINQIQENFYHRIFIIGENQNICTLKAGKEKDQELSDILNNQQLLHPDDLNITDIQKLDSSLSVLRISAPITDDTGHKLGMILFEISSNSIDSIMLEYNPAHGLGISGESYLVGPDYLLRSSSRFQFNSVLKTRVKTRAVEQALAGQAGMDIIEDYRGIEVLSSYGKLDLPQLDWAILSEIDYKEATIPIYRIRNEIIFISIFIFFLVLAVIYILSRRITIPIQNLNQAAKAIGAGNLNIDIKTNLNDEIGELTNSFNQMALELKAERIKSLGSLIDGQETERQRLSRELHDSLGQSLIGLKLKYESCINRSEINAKEQKNFTELALLFDSTIEETRRISNNLMPAALKAFGLFSAIRHLCNEIAESSKIKIHLDILGKDHILDDKIKTYVFRLTQEAITNILKHSQSNEAWILIHIHLSEIKLQYKDDGIGFSMDESIKFTSHGINNMKDRVKLLSGDIQIISAPQKGTEINISIPLNTTENE